MMEEILTGYKKEILEGIHTNIPAQILDFDPVKMEASVQILAKLKIRGKAQVPKAIYRVPVGHGRGGNFAERFPLKKGDIVLLSFSEVSLETILNSETPENQLGDSKFDLTDAIISTALSLRSQTLPAENQEDYCLFNIPTGHKIIFKSNGDLIIDVERASIKAKEINIDSEIINAPNSELNIKTVNSEEATIAIANINGKPFEEHTHSGVQGGPDNTGGVA